MDSKIINLKKLSDERGDLIILLKGDKAFRIGSFGQLYLVTFSKKGAVRGNHYHKKIREWFTVSTGNVRVFLKDVKTGRKKIITLNSGKNHSKIVEVGPFVAHAIVSISRNACVVNYSNAIWSKRDTFEHKLI